MLVFLRQLGCRFCKQQIAGLEAIRAKLCAADVHLVAVALGQLEHGRGWIAETGFGGELYLDTTTSGDPSRGTAAPQSRPYRALRPRRGRELVQSERGKAAAAAASASMKPLLRVDVHNKDSKPGRQNNLWAVA